MVINKVKKPMIFIVAALFLFTLTFALRPTASATVPVVNVLTSVNTSSVAGGGTEPVVSKDGRYVAFTSSATDLVTGDTNGVDDVFVRDVVSGTTSRVSVSSGGTQGNGSSSEPSISSNGRYVAFTSSATNLIASDSNSTTKDIYVHDRTNGTTEVVSLNNYGSQTSNGGHSERSDITRDGRYIIFESTASNLVSSDNNAVRDIFVRDRKLSTTVRLSESTSGTEANDNSSFPSISCDGAFAVFKSPATNLTSGDTNNGTDLFLVDRVGGRVIYNVTQSGNGHTGDRPEISCDGSTVTFSSSANNLVGSDTNGVIDVFTYDISASAFQRVSVSSNGTEGDATSSLSSVSSNGNCVVFESNAQNLDGSNAYITDIYLRNISSGTTELVSKRISQNATGNSLKPQISADGKYVVYQSSDQMLAADTNYDNDVYRSETGASDCGF